MSTVFFAGWQTGDLSEGQIQGSPTVASTTQFGNLYGLDINDPTGTSLSNFNTSAIGPLGNLVQASIPITFIRFDFVPLLLPVSGDETIIDVDGVGGTSKFKITVNNLGQLGMRDAANALKATGTTALILNSKYTLQAKVGTGNPASWEILTNGVSEISGSNNLSANNTAEIRIGKAVNLNSNPVHFRYGNYLWSDSAYPGPGICAALIPIGNGFYVSGIPNGATQLWQCVDEVPPDGDVSYINGLTAGQAYTAVLNGNISGIVNSVKSYANMKRDGGVNALVSTRLRSGSTDSDTTPGSRGVNYIPFQKIFDTDPNTGLPWASTAVNVLQVGMAQSDANPGRLTATYVIVDYLPVVPVTSTPISDVYAPSSNFKSVLQSSP